MPIVAADHRAFLHGFVIDQHALDFHGTDPDAAGLQHVVAAAAVPVIPVGVAVVLVAGADPFALDRRLGLLVLVPVIRAG
jgi:hypothetical protein